MKLTLNIMIWNSLESAWGVGITEELRTRIVDSTMNLESLAEDNLLDNLKLLYLVSSLGASPFPKMLQLRLHELKTSLKKSCT